MTNQQQNTTNVEALILRYTGFRYQANTRQNTTNGVSTPPNWWVSMRNSLGTSPSPKRT